MFNNNIHDNDDDNISNNDDNKINDIVPVSVN